MWLHPVVSLVGIALSPSVLTPGDTLEVRLGLRKQAKDEPADAYRVVVRGRLDLREANDIVHRFERLYARFAGATGRSLEFVSNRRPLGGRYPIRLWDVGDAFEDVFSIPLPSDLEPGRYRVGVSLHRQQLVRNIALRDWLRPRGGIGVHVADVEVRAVPE